MITVIWILAALGAAAVLLLVLQAAARAYLAWRGTRVVTCPETGTTAAVEVDARHAAVTAALGDADLRLRDCSRWPGRHDCGQECLQQIEAAPADCLARTMLTRWYEGKSCAFCRKPFTEIQWLEHKPALISPKRRTLGWHEVRADRIPEVLSTHLPVCWNCHVIATLRREHPELVVERPQRAQGWSRREG